MSLQLPVATSQSPLHPLSATTGGGSLQVPCRMVANLKPVIQQGGSPARKTSGALVSATAAAGYVSALAAASANLQPITERCDKQAVPSSHGAGGYSAIVQPSQTMVNRQVYLPLTCRTSARQQQQPTTTRFMLQDCAITTTNSMSIRRDIYPPAQSSRLVSAPAPEAYSGVRPATAIAEGMKEEEPRVETRPSQSHQVYSIEHAKGASPAVQAHQIETQRADAAEAAAKELQEEAERMQSETASVTIALEEALSAANADKHAMRGEVDSLKDDLASQRASSASQQQELDVLKAEVLPRTIARLRAEHRSETQRADAAEAAAKELQGEADQIRPEKPDVMMMELEEALSAANADKHTMRGEVDSLKTDLTSQRAVSASQQQKLDVLKAEVLRLQAEHQSETQRADAAETAAKELQEEAEHMKSERADAMLKLEEALSAANADKNTMQGEIDGLKADQTSQRVAVDAQQQELARLQAAYETELQRADAAEALANELHEETLRLQTGRAEADKEAEAVLLAASSFKASLEQAELRLVSSQEEHDELVESLSALKAELAKDPAGPEDPSVKIELRCDDTLCGESIAIVGASSEIGAWDVSKCLVLMTCPGAYPLWTITLSSSALADFKFVKIANDHVVWENLEENRSWFVDKSEAGTPVLRSQFNNAEFSKQTVAADILVDDRLAAG